MRTLSDVHATTRLPLENDEQRPVRSASQTSALERLVCSAGSASDGRRSDPRSVPFSLQLFEQTSSTYTYIVADGHTHEAIIIDPVVNTVARDVQLIQQLGLRLRYASTAKVCRATTASGFRCSQHPCAR